jgi:ribosomal protein S18 acetylase RimI-like enzyme
VKLNEKEAYLFDAYTVPQYRQNALHTSVTTKALIYLKNKGYKNVLLLVFNKNIYARKALRRIGFKPKKMVTLIKIFNLKYYIWRDFKEKL